MFLNTSSAIGGRCGDGAWLPFSATPERHATNAALAARNARVDPRLVLPCVTLMMIDEGATSRP